MHKQQSALLNELGVEALFLGVGVDRMDYTKGIPERFLAIERFLEKYPAYQGKLTFAQIGAPSRTPHQALSRPASGSGSGGRGA